MATPNSILFGRYQAGYNGIYMIEPDGTGEQALITSPGTNGGSYDFIPGAWNPNRSKLAYLSNINTQPDVLNVFVRNLVDGTDTQITSGMDDYITVDWSPDGSTLAVSMGTGTVFQVYLLNPDGSGLHPLTSGMENHGSPAYSPSGNQIVFETYPVPGSRDAVQLWMMNSDGSSPIQLTANQAAEMNPSWSPDGQWIVYESDMTGHAHIRKINVNTGEVILLTQPSATYWDFQPVWTNAGIVFSSNRDFGGSSTQSSLYIMGSNGGNLRRLTYSDSMDYAGIGFLG